MPNNIPKIYNITATEEVDRTDTLESVDTYQELVYDYGLVGDRMKRYEEFFVNPSNNVITDTYTEVGGFTSSEAFPVNNLPDKRFYMVMAQIFDKSSDFNIFKNAIVTDDMSRNTPNLEKKFDKIVDEFRVKVKSELEFSEKKYKTIKKSEEYSTFTKQDVYNKGKTRKFTYTTVPVTSTEEEQKSNLLLLYQGNNNGDKTIWTDKTQFN